MKVVFQNQAVLSLGIATEILHTFKLEIPIPQVPQKDYSK